MESELCITRKHENIERLKKKCVGRVRSFERADDFLTLQNKYIRMCAGKRSHQTIVVSNFPSINLILTVQRPTAAAKSTTIAVATS